MPRPGEAIEVERVQRLVPLEQHVVGDVDDVADRAHPGLHEALLHPRRRRPDRHPGDPREVPRAAVGRLDRRPLTSATRRVAVGGAGSGTANG